MRHELRVNLRYPDVDGDWQDIAVLPAPDGDGPVWPVTVEPEITMCGSGWLDGYMFDSDLLERRLAEYIGDNGLGEAIFLSMNEGQEDRGTYWVDKRDCYRLGETSIPLSHARAVCVEWRLAHIIETNADLANAVHGTSNRPRPRRVPIHTGGMRIRKNPATGRFEVVDTELNAVMATCKHEPMAEAVLSLYVSPWAALNIQGGTADCVTLPWGLEGVLDVLIVDWDNDSSDPAEVQGGVLVTSEDGEQAVACVYSPDVRHPDGTTMVDRAVSEYQNQT